MDQTAFNKDITYVYGVVMPPPVALLLSLLSIPRTFQQTTYH